MKLDEYMNKNYYKILKALSGLNDQNETELMYKTGLSYCHVNKLVEQMKKVDLLKTEKIGRTVKVSLSPKGKKVNDLMIKLEKEL